MSQHRIKSTMNTTQIVYLVSDTEIPNNIERRSGFGGIQNAIGPKKRFVNHIWHDFWISDFKK